MEHTLKNRSSDLIRRIILSYLIAITVNYLALPSEWQTLDKIAPLAVLAPVRILIMTAILTVSLS